MVVALVSDLGEPAAVGPDGVDVGAELIAVVVVVAGGCSWTNSGSASSSASSCPSTREAQLRAGCARVLTCTYDRGSFGTRPTARQASSIAGQLTSRRRVTGRAADQDCAPQRSRHRISPVGRQQRRADPHALSMKVCEDQERSTRVLPAQARARCDRSAGVSSARSCRAADPTGRRTLQRGVPALRRRRPRCAG